MSTPKKHGRTGSLAWGDPSSEIKSGSVSNFKNVLKEKLNLFSPSSAASGRKLNDDFKVKKDGEKTKKEEEGENVPPLLSKTTELESKITTMTDMEVPDVPEVERVCRVQEDQTRGEF